jgi:hypothetical protein
MIGAPLRLLWTLDGRCRRAFGGRLRADGAPALSFQTKATTGPVTPNSAR